MPTSTQRAMYLNGLENPQPRKPMTHKTKFTDADYQKIETMHGLGMNDGDIAVIMGVSEDTFSRMLKTDAVLRECKLKGKATSNLRVLNTLHKQITREEVEKEKIIIKVDRDGNEISRETKTVKHRIDPNARLLEFYLSTRMGFVKTTKVEHSGTDGDPIRLRLSKLSDEELAKEESKLDID